MPLQGFSVYPGGLLGCAKVWGGLQIACRPFHGQKKGSVSGHKLVQPGRIPGKVENSPILLQQRNFDYCSAVFPPSPSLEGSRQPLHEQGVCVWPPVLSSSVVKECWKDTSVLSKHFLKIVLDIWLLGELKQIEKSDLELLQPSLLPAFSPTVQEGQCGCH